MASADDAAPSNSDVYDDEAPLFDEEEEKSDESEDDLDNETALQDVQVQVEGDYELDATADMIYDHDPKAALAGCQKPTINAHKSLHRIHEDAMLESVDLSIVFANGNQFFIDGESLIYEILNNPSHQRGQILHFFFLLESIVYRFTSKDAKFSIVFFDDWVPIWRTYEKSYSLALYLRNRAKQHLENVLNISVYQMTNCWSPEWVRVIDRNPMAFILVSMGTFGDKIVSTPDESRGLELITWAFRHHWMAFLTQGVDCCRFQPRIVNMNKIFAWYAPSTQARGEKRYAKVFPQFWTLLLSKFTSDTESDSAVAPGYGNASRQVSSRLSFWETVLAPLVETMSPLAKALAELVIVHAHLLAYLPIAHRAQFLSPAQLRFASLPKIMAAVDSFFSGAVIFDAEWLNPEDEVDHFDSRLLTKLCCMEKLDLSHLPEPEKLWAVHNRLFGAENNCSGNKLRYSEALEEYRIKEDSSVAMTIKKSKQIKWYPLDIKEINDIFKDSKLGTDDDYLTNSELSPSKWISFEDQYHWKSAKALTDDYDRTHETFSNIPPTDKRQRRKWERDRLLFMRHMQISATSLEGTNTQFRAIVTTADKEKEGKEKPGAVGAKSHAGGGNKKGSAGGKGSKPMSKKAEIIAKNKERLEQERDIPRDRDAWTTCINELKSMALDLALVRLDTFVGVAGTIEYKMKAYKEIITRCRLAWEQLSIPVDWHSLTPESAFLASRVYNTARILTTSPSIATAAPGDKASTDCWAEVGTTLLLMGFPRAARAVQNLQKGAPSGDGGEGEAAQMVREMRFQLEWMGALLSRLDRQDKDPRVETFIPDTWQRELLDVVDKRNSALVVAPTSSGKTYVSYYCMEQILRESDDGIVVYVSPTKALVNQVAATVYARFSSKRMPPGRAVLGTFTRDFRQDAMNSQILVTVPECLAILLLSPARDAWVKRLRYIIFDEVHTLGEENTGLVWERLLNIVSCPFLALSATVANADDLRNWMQNVQPNIPVICIEHSERYCDLKKMAVAVHKGELQLREIHPLKALANPLIEESDCVQNLPTSIDMSPSEVLQVYDVLVKVSARMEVKPATPLQSIESYFAEDVFISRPKVRQFLKYMLDYVGEYNLTTAVVNGLPEGAFSREAERLQELEDVTLDRLLALDKVKQRKITYIIQLITLLQKKKLLPAILFLDDRAEIELIATTLTKWFERRELKLFSNDKNRTATIREAKKQEKAAKRKTEKLTKLEKEDLLKNNEMPTNTVLNVPHQDCTLAGRLTGKDKDYIFENRLRNMNDTHIFKRCLSRGIAYHHPGLNGKMRTAVEGLFRRRYLQMVSATGTLAVGIHMPCKTVVFFKDNVLLTPLQYHQRSGRAGRRGYDLVGNVIFCSIEQHRIRHLLTANLSSLKGDFTLDFSFVLRIMILLNSADNKARAVKSIRALVDCPFISVTQPRMFHQVKMFFQFALQVLADNDIIDINGCPMPMASYIAHLSQNNPYNLLFSVFLRNGLLHKLCMNSTDSNRSANLCSVLAHIFGRLELSLSQQNDFKHGCLFRRESLVVMPDLPSEFRTVAQSYTGRLRHLIKQYCCVTIRQLASGNVLPLSKLSPNQNSPPPQIVPSCPLLSAIAQSSSPDGALAPILCLSGSSLHELVDKALDKDPLELWAMGLYVDPKMLPRMSSDDLLNAYALDFLRHGMTDHLIAENRIREGEVFSVLREFHMTLQTLTQSTKEMTVDRDDVVYKALDRLTKEFGDRFNIAFPRTMYNLV